MPWALALIIGLLFAAWAMQTVDTRHTITFPKTQSLQGLSSTGLQRWMTASNIIGWIAMLLIVIAIARPQWIISTSNAQHAGIDIVALLDTSGSMNAEDFAPQNRMDVATETLSTFIKKRPNDRIGLVVFGTDAFTKSPLTLDHDIVRFQLANTAVGDAGEGTAIGLAIATGIHRLNQSKSPSKVLILITDGVNNTGQIDPLSATALAKKNNIKIYTIGIGDKKGAPIPIYHPTYGKRYARQPNGQLLLTQFDDRILKQIATETNAAYFNATNKTEFSEIFEQINALETIPFEQNKRHRVVELFPWLIGLALFFIVFNECIVSTRLYGVKT